MDANVAAWGTKLQGVTPLHLAAERGHLKVMDVLLERGANIDARTKGPFRCEYHHYSLPYTISSIFFLTFLKFWRSNCVFLGVLQGHPFIWLPRKGIGKQLGFWSKMVLFCPLISMTADSTLQFIIALASNGPMMSSSVYRTVRHHPARRHHIALKTDAVFQFSTTSSVFKLYSIRLSLCYDLRCTQFPSVRCVQFTAELRLFLVC